MKVKVKNAIIFRTDPNTGNQMQIPGTFTIEIDYGKTTEAEEFKLFDSEYLTERIHFENPDNIFGSMTFRCKIIKKSLWQKIKEWFKR